MGIGVEEGTSCSVALAISAGLGETGGWRVPKETERRRAGLGAG